MREILQELILDAQKPLNDLGVPRRTAVTPVSGKATICIGVRRSGKSTLMAQLREKLVQEGVQRENILQLNFFDNRLHDLQHQNLEAIVDAYFSLYPEKKNTETIYCFFDEIQVLPNWEPFIDRLMRAENCEVYLTGSSARMLSKEIATQMRGRSLSWEVFPFSFPEFLDFHQQPYSAKISSKERLLLGKTFEKYWQTGGFPEVAGLDRALRIRIHQEYLDAVLFRDLVERHNISQPRAIVDLANRLIDNTGSLYSAKSLEGYLKSLGHKISRATIADYISWFEDAYFLFSVGIFDASLARVNANPKKIYCIDHALVTSTSSGVLLNAGHLLENLIFIALRRITPRISYYKTSKGHEIDFLAQLPSRQRMLVQVREKMTTDHTKEREVRAMREAMKEMGLEQGTIVTRHDNETLNLPEGQITVTPAWRFLLSLEEQNA